MSPARGLKLAVYCLILLSCLLVAFNLIRMDVQRLLSVEYRVFGRVQGKCIKMNDQTFDNIVLFWKGVFFRKYTKEKADQLGIFGWVKNERDGTVSGLMQGTEAKIDNMQVSLTYPLKLFINSIIFLQETLAFTQRESTFSYRQVWIYQWKSFGSIGPYKFYYKKRLNFCLPKNDGHFVSWH